MEKVYINLPNVHYFGVDYSRFPKIDFMRNDDNVRFILNAFVIVNKSNLVAREYCRFLIKLEELISA